MAGAAASARKTPTPEFRRRREPVYRATLHVDTRGLSRRQVRAFKDYWARRLLDGIPDPPPPPSLDVLRKELKARYPYCQGCGYRPAKANASRALHVHHVKPGGPDVRENLLVLCARCHALAHAILERTPKRKWSKETMQVRLLTLAAREARKT